MEDKKKRTIGLAPPTEVVDKFSVTKYWGPIQSTDVKGSNDSDQKKSPLILKGTCKPIFEFQLIPQSLTVDNLKCRLLAFLCRD